MQANTDKNVQIIVLLEECIQLLSENDEKRWAEILTRLMRYYIESSNKKEALSLIKKLYGGAGTFNDVVLHKNGIPLINENNQLTKARHELYEECVEKIIKNRLNTDKVDKIIFLFKENIKLLSENDEKKWAEVLTSLMRYYIERNNDKEVFPVIIELYGESVKFNDVVLYKDGKPLVEENNQLKNVRYELYEECVKKMTL